MRLLLLAAAFLAIAAPAGAAPTPGPGIVRVRLVTELGPVTIAVDTRHAPATSANFLAYVDDHRFDGMGFYRAARSRLAPTFGFVQGGIRTDARRILPPFPHETTTKTGIRHLDGTISMARRTEPNSAGGNFFITVGPMPSMDARPGFVGYAAFGHVVGGMDVVRRILARPTGGGMGGQLILREIRIIRAERLDGKAKPTGLPKPWLIREKPDRPVSRPTAPASRTRLPQR